MLVNRRWSWSIAVIVAMIVGSGCSGEDDTASGLPRPTRAFCAAAANYDKVVALKATSLRRHAELTREIALTAPTDIREDARTVWQSFEKLRDGDESVVDNPEVRDAINHVNRRAGQDCGWFRRQGL